MCNSFLFRFDSFLFPFFIHSLGFVYFCNCFFLSLDFANDCAAISCAIRRSIVWILIEWKRVITHRSVINEQTQLKLNADSEHRTMKYRDCVHKNRRKERMVRASNRQQNRRCNYAKIVHICAWNFIFVLPFLLHFQILILCIISSLFFAIATTMTTTTTPTK